MTLRRRLIVTMVVLVAIGLGALDVITLSSLHSYLYGRVDDQLRNSTAVMEGIVLHDDRVGRPINQRSLQYRVNPEVYVQLLDEHGNVVVSLPSGSRTNPDPAPKIPSPLPVSPPRTPDQLADRGVYRPSADSVDVPSEERNGPRYRLLASSVPGGTLVVATRLDSVDDTLASLRTIVLAVSVGVVVALCALMALVIRRGLRPLEDMSSDADAIAEGDLTKRVQPADAATEIGRLGRALNRMLSQIEAAFAQRTMSEDRLRRFLADASHELRTPLTSIRGYAELLRKDALTDEASRERALARIEGEAARMGVLVADLLTLARMGEQPELERVRVDVTAVAHDAVTDARAVDASHTTTFEAPGPLYVSGDEQRVWQIVHNLLGNAIAHTPAGTTVSVRVWASGERVMLEVADDGPGMDVEGATRAFDRFYRGDAARLGKGSGLGLFIVAATARALGGHVTVDTARGEGARFRVVLPAYGSDEGEAGPPEGTAAGGESAARAAGAGGGGVGARGVGGGVGGGARGVGGGVSGGVGGGVSGGVGEGAGGAAKGGAATGDTADGGGAPPPDGAPERPGGPDAPVVGTVPRHERTDTGRSPRSGP